MEILSNSVSTVVQLWKHINIRNTEHGDDALPKRRFELVLHGTETKRHLQTGT
jgi:hypothetical protein